MMEWRAGDMTERGTRWTARLAAALLGASLLAGCAPNAANMAAPAADRPWKPTGHEDGLWSAQQPAPAPAANATGGPAPVADFSVPANPKLAELPQAVEVDPRHSYRLPELIDLAQRNNPATRVAWQRAREAALAVGMVEATYLPLITANVVGGYQSVSSPLPVPVGTQRYFDTTAEGVSPSIALQWLIFDFGQRSAVADAAKQGAIAANVLFNGEHQKLIFDVTRSYYLYSAAVTRTKIARQTLRNSMAIRDAAEERLAKGLATTVEVAQARQQVAQSELRRVQAEGQERDTYQVLLASMGVNATLPIHVADAGERRLPDAVKVPLDQMITLALAQRPDVIASYSALAATRSGIKAAEAAYLPKVFVAGAVATGQGSFNANGLPGIGQQATGSGVLIGATVPLYDAGLRAAELKQAQSRAAAAEGTFHRTQTAAVTEIVAANNALRTALESYRAATALTSAASTTYDAALEAYKNGVGTVTVATAADSGLLDARQAQADAHAAALVGAANLAFVVGAMTSRDAVP
ncbi:outer membrane protein TolC [Angulomicrobium tetraedrale]|uniref:Protein CyaE n=1 Tax=Ancylobacter tetraedralis TaxID=217068 RepID=A0A839ZG09_9HYPH|nr:TolC family protein [Ancylobacter tetraedralis]MBB3773515.1 outer membrane protein TolC [Ancylobacter tetraedralis]